MTRTTTSLIAGATAAVGVATYLVLPVEQPSRVLSFDNPNSQPVWATIQSSTNLTQWQTETSFVAAAVSSIDWKDYDVNQPAKFYRVQVDWWY